MRLIGKGRYILFCALLVCGLVPQLAQAIGGKYEVRGTNPSGKGVYSGTVQITPKGGELYQVRWDVGTTFSGVGIVRGPVFSVGWGHADKPGYGVVHYVIDPDGSLRGTWATADASGAGTETLTPVK